MGIYFYFYSVSFVSRTVLLWGGGTGESEVGLNKLSNSAYRQAAVHTFKIDKGGVILARKQIISCKNNFKSKDEKERTRNYTKIWTAIIQQKHMNKINGKYK